MRNLILIGALIVAGCQAAPPPRNWSAVSLPNGTMGYSIRCNRDIGYCMNTAGSLCAGGYRILQQDQQHVGSAALPVGDNVVVVHNIRNTMVLSCGA